MALKRQTLRQNTKVIINGKRLGEEIDKDELIILSESWSEKQENFFRKMLKQGGRFNIGPNKFEITVPSPVFNSKGDIDPGVLMSSEDEI